MCQAMRNLCRLDAAYEDVEFFTPRNWKQRETKNIALEMIDFMKELCCRPGQEESFEEWWAMLEGWRASLESAELIWEPSHWRRITFEIWEGLESLGFWLRELWLDLKERIR